MRLRGVNTNQLLALHALLLHQNVTRAAREVGLGQSSMSHALAQLRAHFGDPLLVPAGRALVLTERGRNLVAPVEEAVARLEQVFRQAEPFDPRTSQRIFRLATTDNLELYVLPGLAALLQRTAPGVRVRVTALPDDWPRALQRGDIDLKLGRRYAVADALESRDLSREQFACVVRRDHPARGRLTAEQFAALDHLLVAPTVAAGTEPTGHVDALLARRGLRRRVAMTVPHFLVAPFVVARSDLVLTAPLRLLTPFVRSLALRRLETGLELGTYELSQVWSRARDDDGLRWLRDTIARSISP